MNIYLDPKMSGNDQLYEGSIFIHAPCPSALKLCRLAQELIEEALRPLDPLKVQNALPAERCAGVLPSLKPKFIHHPKSKEHIQGMLAELGYDLEKTHFDVSRMRSAFQGGYLKSSIA